MQLTQTEQQNWDKIRSYVNGIPYLKANVCANCTFGSIYDKNGKGYNFSRQHTFEQVKAMVKEINKTNNKWIR